MLFGLLAALIATVSILTGFWLVSIHTAANSSHVDNGVLLRLNWSYNDSFPRHMTQLLVALATPVILTRTPFDDWSLRSWTFDGLSDQIQHIVAKRSTKPVFKYHSTSQPLDTIHHFNTTAEYKEVIFSGKDFFRAVQNTTAGNYHYSSGGIELLGLHKAPHTPDTLHQMTFDPHEGPGQINYWFGGTNVTAHTHYDTSHNLHVLIHGRKKFLIFPPSAYGQLSLYPCLHQLYRQTQMDIFSCGSQVPRPIEATLKPGEVLYLPPYWFHCVVTVTPSISINVWSDSSTYKLMEEVYNAPIPFEEQWDEQTLMQALKLFIEEMLKNLNLPATFVREVVFSRYGPLLERVSDSEQRDLLPVVLGYCFHRSKTISTTIEQNIAKRASATSQLFIQMGGKEKDRAIREINLANYIEHLAYTLLHSAHADLFKLPLFLKECFT